MNNSFFKFMIYIDYFMGWFCRTMVENVLLKEIAWLTSIVLLYKALGSLGLWNIHIVSFITAHNVVSILLSSDN